MNNTYVNLNTVTLYKTPKFNKIDSVMFSSKLNRDTYFNNIPNKDKIEMTDFTDLFEGRALILPYNYLDLKEYNTMKLHYDDGLGHIEDYYCNVDNYLYISTDACYPVYRIDYFLTFSYMLYNKTIPMVTDRRTVAENSITKNMKADDIAVPRLKYERKPTFYTLAGDTSKAPYYIIYLNKTTGGVGKKSINCKMQMYIGTDSNNQPYLYDIDTYTIGCYVAVCDKDHLNNVLGTEPLEYIEKVIEVDTLMEYLSITDGTNLVSNGYVYLTQDIQLRGVNDGHYFAKVNLFDEGDDLDDNSHFPASKRINLYPNHKKKILNWKPTKGIVIQGHEFDLKDFNDEDFPVPEGGSKVGYEYLYATIYFFNFLGYTFAYPMGYKHEAVNMDYMIKWQSGRNFEYSCDYTKSLAYKELQEYNSQTAKYAKQQAGLQIYYNNQLLEKDLNALDLSRQQLISSYQNETNTLYTQQLNLIEQHKSVAGAVSDVTNIFGNTVNSNGINLFGGVSATASAFVSKQVNQNNIDLLRYQSNILLKQFDTSLKENTLQREQARLNTMYQNDCLAIVRDNTLANIAISNKYNNSKPNAYYETDFTQFTSYYYMFYIDLSEGDVIEQNIKNRYNVLGTYIGYIENWQPSVYEGLYFDYIKGSIIDNSNEVSVNIPNDIYIELISRIEEGVRIWHPSQLAWFGNLTIDNTNLGTPEPYNDYGEGVKANIQHTLEGIMYDDLDDEAGTLATMFGLYPEISNDYITWVVTNQPWGTQTIPADRQTEIWTYAYFLDFDYTVEETKEIIKHADFLTVYEKQWILPQIV